MIECRTCGDRDAMKWRGRFGWWCNNCWDTRQRNNPDKAHQQRLTAAREAVVEAAKEWRASHPMMQSEETETLYKAVARLLKVESEHG